MKQLTWFVLIMILAHVGVRGYDKEYTGAELQKAPVRLVKEVKATATPMPVIKVVVAATPKPTTTPSPEKVKATASPKPLYEATFNISAYTAGVESTDKRPGDKGYGITYSGQKVQENRTIAADYSILPEGTIVKIEGLEYEYEVMDIGGAIKGKKLDIYMPKYKDAIQWGRQFRKVTVIKWGGGKD